MTFKAKISKIKSLKFEYTSRADMAMDIRDIGQIVEKLNEVIKSINQRTKLAKVMEGKHEWNYYFNIKGD